MVKHLKRPLFLVFVAVLSYSGSAQKFTRQDTLRGSVTPEREWWDVQYYTIHVTPDYNSKTIEVESQIQFKVLKPATVM
jgi:hypothetical protein